MAIEKELLDRLFADYNYKKPEDLIGKNYFIARSLYGTRENRHIVAAASYPDR